MESATDQPPLIALVGPTGSGKSALAIQLAGRFNGEIIAADSRTLYRGMDIGTAKPTPSDRRSIPHHIIDVITPDQAFSAAAFQRTANNAIKDIASRGKVPFLVGGSGLYIDSVVFNFHFRPKADIEKRAALQKLSVEELRARILKLGFDLPVNEFNPRHLIRVLESDGMMSPENKILRSNTLIIGLSISQEALKPRIELRVSEMLEQGFIAEVKRLSQQCGWNAPGLQAPGYKAFRSYIEGSTSLEEAKAQLVHNDLQYAKRQRTWFRRNKSIHWIQNREEAEALITTFLSK